MYEWLPFGKTAPRRHSVPTIVRKFLYSQWPTAYRDTSATEGAENSEDVIKPFTLRDKITWNMSFKHFIASNHRCALTTYLDEKYNDYTEDRFSHGNARILRTYCAIDMMYREANNVITIEEDPIRFEGNKIMIDNILSNCAALQNEGLHNIVKGRTIFSGRYNDEEIFLDRISRDLDPKVLQIQNDLIWIFRKIYVIETFESVKFY